MYSEARKLNLIEDLLKIKSEAVLTELENIVKKAIHSKKKEKLSAKDFLGLISQKDIDLMEAAISKDCEKINPDDWK